MIGIDHDLNGFFKRIFGNMPLIGPGHLLAIQAGNPACRLRRFKIAAVTEDGGDIPRGRILELALVTRNGSKRLHPMEPMLGIANDIQNIDGLYRRSNAILQGFQPWRIGTPRGSDVVRSVAWVQDHTRSQPPAINHQRRKRGRFTALVATG